MILQNRFKAHILFFMLVTCSMSTVIPQEESSHEHKQTKKRKRKTIEQSLAALGIGTGIILLAKYGWPQGVPSDLKDPESSDNKNEEDSTTPENTNSEDDQESGSHVIVRPAGPTPNEDKQDTSTIPPNEPKAVPIEPASFENALKVAIQINDAQLVNQVLSQYKALSQYAVSDKKIADSLISYLRERKRVWPPDDHRTTDEGGIRFCASEIAHEHDIPFNSKIADALYSKSHQAYFSERGATLVADICCTTRNKSVVDWVQSKIGDEEMEAIASHLLYQLQHKIIGYSGYEHDIINAYHAIRFIGRVNPNPFKAYDKGSCAMDGLYPYTTAAHATHYLLDNYANPQVEEELKSLAILSNDPVKIITDYVINDTCEPGAMRYMIYLIANQNFHHQNMDDVKALQPRFPYYQDEKKQNLLYYAQSLAPDIPKTLLLSGVDYTDCKGRYADQIIEILDQFDCETLKYTHQPLLYATYRAGQTLYVPGEEDTEEGKNGLKYLKFVKIFLQNNLGTAHDKNNLSVFDYAGGNTVVLDALLTLDVRPDMQDPKKNTIFHRLASAGQMPQFIQYMESKRKPSRPHMSYASAFALISDHPTLIDPRIRNKDGKTALELLRSQQNIPTTIQHRHNKVVELLEQREAKLTASS